MKQNIFKIAFIFCLGVSTLVANVTDYQKLHEEEQEAFTVKMTEAIQKSLPKASKKVRNLYEKIGYQPIWIDKDYFTQYAELLISEIREDLNQSKHVQLLEKFEEILDRNKKKCDSVALEDKVSSEFEMMQLYVNHIERLLKVRKSKYTALSLLQFALKEKSLITALDSICDARIRYRTALDDSNLSRGKNSIKLHMNSLESLTKGEDKERIEAFYKLIDFKSVWLEGATFSKYTKELFAQIESDITVDRTSKIYKDYQNLQSMSVPTDEKKNVKLEFALATLYQAYMSHALYGEIDWEAFQEKLKHKRNADWVVHKVLVSPESLLIDGLSHGTLDYAFKETKPRFLLYARLVTALEKYKSIVDAGGWNVLPKFDNLKPGMHDSVIPFLKERLTKEGDYVACDEQNDTTLYDACLLNAVKKFQTRHGLESAGYIGKLTRKALSENAESKLARIKLNIDRMKWMKRSHDRYQIWVNIPGFEMYMFDEAELIQRMRVIVGRKGHNTPVFYNRVRTIVLNPYWRIPASIIRAELIPKLKKNPHYTNSKKIEIHTGYSEHSPKVNPLKVNWYKYGRRLPPYRFMQSPGVHNALGKMKFLFPNKYSVYMHDTNQKNLFSKDIRALSHGCVRLHKPLDLLENFADLDAKLDFKKAKETLEHNKKTPLRLSHTIPVDLVYLTTWVEMDGMVHFRDDIYGYDSMQLANK